MTLPHAWLAVGDHGHLGRMLGVVVGLVELDQVVGQGGDCHAGREAVFI
jgi:hypothetical protein